MKMLRGSLNNAAGDKEGCNRLSWRSLHFCLGEGTSLSSANIASRPVFTLQRRYFGLRFLRAGIREGTQCFPLSMDVCPDWN